MIEEFKNIILDNWIKLVNECNCNEVARKLVVKDVFTEDEIKRIFSKNNVRHNNREFLFKMMEKKDNAFQYFVQALGETNQLTLAKQLKSLSPIVTHSCTPTVMPKDEIIYLGQEPQETEIHVHVNNSRTALSVEVVNSKTFQDTIANCKGLEYYSTRSKNRGRVLIINNYDFSATKGKKKYTDRTGALIDQANLKQLFNQMGGWRVELHENKTAEEMKLIFKDFASYHNDKHCDICFIIIMSHGEEHLNISTVIGVDGSSILTSSIEELFTNRNCQMFKDKPKVLLYQTCRGDDIDIALRRVTETDGISKSKEDKIKGSTSLRNMEDMLIGHATLQGRKAHRDPYRGSWYIEFICETFMKSAWHLPVDDMLTKVDQRLRKTMSEALTMQTSEIKNRGFKKLFLNPGIYFDGSVMKTF